MNDTALYSLKMEVSILFKKLFEAETTIRRLNDLAVQAAARIDELERKLADIKGAGQ